MPHLSKLQAKVLALDASSLKDVFTVLAVSLL